MKVRGQSRRVTIYVDENDMWGNKPLYMAILETLKKHDCAGATVTRALAGFGSQKNIHATSLDYAQSTDLPVIIEWIDSPVRVKRVLPKLQDMVTDGLIIVDKVKVAFYSQRQLGTLPSTTPVNEIMRRDIQAVRENSPLLEVSELLLDNVYRALLVVDEDKRVAGIVTEGNLLDKVQLLADSTGRSLTRAEMAAELQSLRRIDQTVAKAMTSNPVTISKRATIIDAVNRMIERDVKRLPVVNSRNRLIGIISRVDVLRAISQPPVVELPRENPPPGHHVHVGGIMAKNVPAVSPETSLDEVVGLVVSNARRRVIVVDEKRRVVGIITDGNLIKHAITEQTEKMHRPGTPLPMNKGDKFYLGKHIAADVMTKNVITATPDTPLSAALQLLLSHNVKRLPVVNEKGKLVGLVGRGALLQVLGQQEIGLNVF